METQKDNYTKRRKFFIDRKFQSKFIIKFCLLIILACILFGGLIYLLSSETTTTTFENSRLVIKSTADYLLPLLALTSLVTIIIVGLAMIITTLFISHKIAGPAYRFEKVANTIASGDLTLDVSLRPKDQLQPIAKGLTEMIKKLRSQVLKIKERISELTAYVEKIKSSQDEKLKPHMIDLEKIINELNKEIKYFKL